MNDNNYGSLDACKRLLDVGKIQIDTDFCWFERETDDWIILPSDDVSIKAIKDNHAYPAVCMAEAWRELQKYLAQRPDCLPYIRLVAEKDDTIVEAPFMSATFSNTNPTDSLIDLLIWIRSQK